jgi:hypothetical protein
LTKFSSELCTGLSKPLGRFVSQMLFGIQSSQDGKLSNIARSLKEDISLIRSEKRLSRNLKSAEVLAAVDLIRAHTQGRGIWTIDRGGGRKKLLAPLTAPSQFVGPADQSNSGW